MGDSRCKAIFFSVASHAALLLAALLLLTATPPTTTAIDLLAGFELTETTPLEFVAFEPPDVPTFDDLTSGSTGNEISDMQLLHGGLSGDGAGSGLGVGNGMGVGGRLRCIFVIDSMPGHSNGPTQDEKNMAMVFAEVKRRLHELRPSDEFCVVISPYCFSKTSPPKPILATTKNVQRASDWMDLIFKREIAPVIRYERPRYPVGTMPAVRLAAQLLPDSLTICCGCRDRGLYPSLDECLGLGCRINIVTMGPPCMSIRTQECFSEIVGGDFSVISTPYRKLSWARENRKLLWVRQTSLSRDNTQEKRMAIYELSERRVFRAMQLGKVSVPDELRKIIADQVESIEAHTSKEVVAAECFAILESALSPTEMESIFGSLANRDTISAVTLLVREHLEQDEQLRRLWLHRYRTQRDEFERKFVPWKKEVFEESDRRLFRAARLRNAG